MTGCADGHLGHEGPDDRHRAELQEDEPREGGREREAELDGERSQSNHGKGRGQRCFGSTEHCKFYSLRMSNSFIDI